MLSILCFRFRHGGYHTPDRHQAGQVGQICFARELMVYRMCSYNSGKENWCPHFC